VLQHHDNIPGVMMHQFNLFQGIYLIYNTNIGLKKMVGQVEANSQRPGAKS
jgi:hypothetical protein